MICEYVIEKISLSLIVCNRKKFSLSLLRVKLNPKISLFRFSIYIASTTQIGRGLIRRSTWGPDPNYSNDAPMDVNFVAVACGFGDHGVGIVRESV